MKIDRRITNGLVWAGVVIVLGVPAADLVSAQLAGPAAPQVASAVPQPVEPQPKPAPATQAPAPAPTPKPEVPKPVAPQPLAAAPQAGDPVQSYLRSGRDLPSYISDAPAPVASTPAPVEPVTPAAPEPASPVVETAALPPSKVAPVPMPHSMRPRPVEVPLIVDTPAVLPPARMGEVTAADLEDWETGPLSDFLARRARERGEAAPSDYDANGFFLDQGPNNRQPQRSYLVGPADDYYFAD